MQFNHKMTAGTSFSLKLRSCCWNRQRSPLIGSFLLFKLMCTSVIKNATTQSYPTFQILDSDSQFQTHFLDGSSGSIYIGALNNIFKFNGELGLENSISTGPVQDNQLCRPPPSLCVHGRTTTDHYSKVILVHQDRLITCGSIYQGTCDIRDVDSLNVTYGGSIQEVVPNTPAGLAVAFVAVANEGEVLYVASSYGRWLRENTPTVSTRLIDNTVEERALFRTSSNDAEIIITSGTISSSPDDQRFNISYIHGFASGQFSYFVAFQPSDVTTSSKYTSKLVRLCQGDPNFYSYIELLLVCAKDNDYNLVQSAHVATLSLGGNATKEVLVAAFSKPETEISDVPSSESAVCIYAIEDINRAFFERRINCAQKHTDNTEIRWLGSSPCRDSWPLVDLIETAGPDKYCHQVDIMHPLGGDNRDITISATPVYESNSYITAVAAVQHFETSIIFAGDSNGRLRKLRVEDLVSAIEYENRRLHQTPVIRNGLSIPEDEEFVFVISENQVTKIPVEECHEYVTCEECHAARDPYCGWCSLQSQCTRRTDLECVGSEDGTTARWLSFKDDCLSIYSVSPMYAPAETVTELTIDITSLPPIPSTGSFRCVFIEGTKVLGEQPALVTSEMSEIKCNTVYSIAAYSKGFRRVELQIHYVRSGQSNNIAATEYYFYDCTKLSSCSICAGNKYGCHWCLYSNQCEDNTQTCNNTDIRSEGSCPRILHSEEIIIPVGQRRRIEINGDNFPSDTFPYTCQIDFGGQDQLIIQAYLVLSKIECDPTLFNYPGTEKSRKGVLKVYWGDYALDMESNLTVTLYKCDQMAETVVDGTRQQTCGTCLTLDDNYQCGWCPDSNSCLSKVNAATCPQNQLLGRDMNCPNPTVFSVSPLSGHISGGTILSIGGYNLGLVPGDLKSITVAGAACLSMEFVSSQKLHCTTSSVTRPTSGKVIIQFNDTKIPDALSDKDFSYVKPTIMSVFPTKGPQSGGTRLFLRGKNLNAGTDRAVQISANPCSSQKGYPCEIIESNNPEEIVCRTSYGNITNGRLSVTFDLGCEAGDDTFSYREDPVIDSFEKVTSIVSGGLDITISGDFFDIIQEASMIFRISDEALQTECSNRSAKMKVYCNTPNVAHFSTSRPFLLPAENISLHMDGVTKYNSLGPSFPGRRETYFTFYNDPVYYRLPSGGSLLKIQYEEQSHPDIIVQGDNLTLASSVEDVTVNIGTWKCLIFKLTNEEVVCRPDQPIIPGIYDVLILHGNLLFNVGQIEYKKMFLSSSTVIIIILSSILSFVLLVLIIILIYCCAKADKGPKGEKKDTKVKHSYLLNNSSANTMQMTLQGQTTDNVSDHIYFGVEMDYLTITPDVETNVTEGSENTALEKDSFEENIMQEGILEEDDESEAIKNIDMEEVTGGDETQNGNPEKTHYNRKIVEDKALTNVKDPGEIVSEMSDQESDPVDGSRIDGALQVSDETGINPYCNRICSGNNSSGNSEYLPEHSDYRTRIHLD